MDYTYKSRFSIGYYNGSLDRALTKNTLTSRTHYHSLQNQGQPNKSSGHLFLNMITYWQPLTIILSLFTKVNYMRHALALLNCLYSRLIQELFITVF